MKEREKEYSLWLSGEEAIGLLDVILVSPVDLTAEQRAAVMKLSEFCRHVLREQQEKNSVCERLPTLTPGAYAA